jgi:Zn finger protein HypA/HybF involved in hydrogenase expression
MTALRCTSCDRRFPVRVEFGICPDCVQQTGRVAGESDMTDLEVSEALFTAWCRRNGRTEEAA